MNQENVVLAVPIQRKKPQKAEDCLRKPPSEVNRVSQDLRDSLVIYVFWSAQITVQTK